MRKSIQINKSIFFVVIALVMMTASVATHAATFTVTNTNDNFAAGSLRWAIFSANLNAGADTIEFDAVVFATPKTIVLTNGQLEISADLTINGPGADLLTISGNNVSRAFLVSGPNINDPIDVTFNAFTIANGNSTFDPGFAGSGGGIVLNGDNLTLNNVVVRNNTASNSGGGIRTQGGTLVVKNSRIINNFSGSCGGGIVSDDFLKIEDSTISGNQADASGGGVCVVGDALISRSTITGNTADGDGGGGIVLIDGASRISNTTISGNTGNLGAGVLNAIESTLTLINSTIAFNGGGGLQDNGVSDVRNTIIAGNTFTSGNPQPKDITNPVEAASNNLVGDAATAGGLLDGVGGNIVGVDPSTVMASGLASNGGPTKTHKLVSGSPAINAGLDTSAVDENGDAFTTDQRGGSFSRFVGTTDIGAYEFNDSDGDAVEDHVDNCGTAANPSLIVFGSIRDGIYEIYRMNADGTDQTRLTFTINGGESEPIFSPDETEIVFNTHRDGDAEIYRMNPDGTSQTSVMVEPNSFEDYPAFSPDGSKIAFTSNRSGSFQIWVVNANGTNPVNLSNHASNDHEPMFSPDGSKIVFASSRDGDSEIYIMNADGSGQTRLTNDPGIDSTASFSPDGSKVMFSSTRTGNYEIYLMNPDGTGLVNITNNPANDADPTFSPDGSKIAFASERNSSDYEIWVMNADGTDPVRLTYAPGNDFDPGWGGQLDSDGDGEGNACEAAIAPTTTTMGTPADTQYSDVVTLSSTTVASGSPVTTGTVEFFVNGVSVGTDNVDSNGVATLNTQILLPAGSYPVSATYAANAAFETSTGSSTLTVTKENATVTAAPNNPVAVKVTAPGGNAGPVTLCADIGDAQDGSLGDISKAVPVTFVLAPVAPGSTLQLSDNALSAGSACVTFNSVPVNVYDITITVGGNHYTGSGSSVLAVYDPSLGFTTGGGRVIHPTTGNTIHFGFNFKYDRKTFKGQMIVMEHTPNGVVKLKSNSLTSLSIVGTQAIVLGKANIADGAGNLSFRLNVTDNGEPGSSDKFGLKLATANGTVFPAFTIDPPVTVLGGNIQVPQGVKK